MFMSGLVSDIYSEISFYPSSFLGEVLLCHIFKAQNFPCSWCAFNMADMLTTLSFFLANLIKDRFVRPSLAVTSGPSSSLVTVYSKNLMREHI